MVGLGSREAAPGHSWQRGGGVMGCRAQRSAVVRECGAAHNCPATYLHAAMPQCPAHLPEHGKEKAALAVTATVSDSTACISLEEAGSASTNFRPHLYRTRVPAPQGRPQPPGSILPCPAHPPIQNTRACDLSSPAAAINRAMSSLRICVGVFSTVLLSTVDALFCWRCW